MARKTPLILVIEDDKFLRKAYQSKLTLSGFDVEVAMDGEEGLTKLHTAKPDVILLDLVMAKKTGFDVLEAIKAEGDARLMRIPIIVLTNLSQEAEMRKAKSLGAAEFLVKSNTPINQIVEKIRYHLGKNSKPSP